ncbi:MAG: hypothetical protein JWR13_692, partial [Mycobacterium sp.]|nr:hypothetical protein [Mycobacterium sp.]
VAAVLLVNGLILVAVAAVRRTSKTALFLR